mmetsp:Transcript_125596/g.349725  ORF Transcript_125596/g.349725 Transcript_125596/m.349725 type:complete len:106 (-) Transcript_125596:645-962(-)
MRTENVTLASKATGKHLKEFVKKATLFAGPQDGSKQGNIRWPTRQGCVLDVWNVALAKHFIQKNQGTHRRVSQLELSGALTSVCSGARLGKRSTEASENAIIGIG